MPRLFVAVGLPAAVIGRLLALQPKPGPGIRLVESGQMHLTLHFLGEADVERISAALTGVKAAEFPLVIEGVGQFKSADGVVTLWAGVRASSELLGLYKAIAAALAGEGGKPQAQGYTPHITLARVGPEAPADSAAEFVTCRAGVSLPAVPIAAFGLYSSAFVGDVPVYQCERWFTLQATGPRVLPQASDVAELSD